MALKLVSEYRINSKQVVFGPWDSSQIIEHMVHGTFWPWNKADIKTQINCSHYYHNIMP